MSDQEIIELMDSIPTDDEGTSNDEEGDFDSDSDSVEHPNDINAVEDTVSIDRELLPPSSASSSSKDETAVLLEPVVIQPSMPSTSTETEQGVMPPLTRTFKRRNRVRSPELVEEEGGPNVPTTGTFTGNILSMTNDSKQFQSISWRKKNLQLHVNELIFRGENQLPPNLKELITPYDCFRYFMNDELFQHLTDQANFYARQQNIRTKFKVELIELHKFVGIMIYMSVYRYPNTMPVLRFEEVRRYLHYNDNSAAVKNGAPGYDRLYKVRPLINHLNKRFLSVPMLQRLCVDEQMCATKMTGTILRQYMPKKPHKWGYKFFSLCDSTGFSYAFEIYSGAGDNTIPEGALDLGASSNVVVRIYTLGTVRVNRVPNCKLSSDQTLTAKKTKRGYSEEYVGNVYGIDISSVLWHNTKTVRLLSTYVGSKRFLSKNTDTQPSKAIRWDKKEKKHHEVDCPYIIKEYNRHMGGVDLMDGLLGRYHIRMKTRKWSNRIFYHLVDVAMVNAYILYHRIHPKERKVELPLFRTEVAESLCMYEIVPEKREVLVDHPLHPPGPLQYQQSGHTCQQVTCAMTK
ncbi:hypothetical protein NQ314_015783 [Rhamnusium bicolor]|uniref:PiggyBac transposable element-derived protein domain-containing protein n=1 Tax=Rhamnusium bicolor TaxID=1586634 RepID=A0AAV8WYM1_9CUCU|nr:hypothetical protein NQ314_015783 [Rhamnusium bicolor]